MNDARDDDRDREEFEAARADHDAERSQLRAQSARSMGSAIGQLPAEAAVPAALLAVFMSRMSSDRGKSLDQEFADWKAANPKVAADPVTVDGVRMDGDAAGFLGGTTLADGRNAREALVSEHREQRHQAGQAPTGLPGLSGLSVADEVGARMRSALGEGAPRVRGGAPEVTPRRDTGPELG